MEKSLLQGFVEMQEDAQRDKFLTFMIGREQYGIAISFVTEIVGIQPITEMPELPGYVRGIINLRGTIIPVIDVRLRFKMPLKEYDDRTCIIVVEIRDSHFGLIVDCVTEVMTMTENDITPNPCSNGTGDVRYIKEIGKIGNDVKMILDCEIMIQDAEFGNITEK